MFVPHPDSIFVDSYGDYGLQAIMISPEAPNQQLLSNPIDWVR
jgi:hypothetical protein